MQNFSGFRKAGEIKLTGCGGKPTDTKNPGGSRGGSSKGNNPGGGRRERDRRKWSGWGVY